MYSGRQAMLNVHVVLNETVIRGEIQASQAGQCVYMADKSMHSVPCHIATVNKDVKDNIMLLQEASKEGNIAY